MKKKEREEREEAVRREAARQTRIFRLPPWVTVPIHTKGFRNPYDKGTACWLDWEKAAALQCEIDKRRARRAVATSSKSEAT